MERSLFDLRSYLERPAPDDGTLAQLGTRFPRYASDALLQPNSGPGYTNAQPAPSFDATPSFLTRMLSGRPFAPTPQEQATFNGIAKHYAEGLRDWVEFPAEYRRMSAELDPRNVPEHLADMTWQERMVAQESLRRKAADWGAGTALGMIGIGRLRGAAPQGAVVGTSESKLPPPAPVAPAPSGMVVGPGGKLMRLEDIPATVGEGDGSIYRAGDSSPSNLAPRPGEVELSFRSSLSEPYPMGEKGVIFHKPEYRRYDPSKLAPGSVTNDNKPDGHVSVAPPPINSIEKLQKAVMERGKIPKKGR